MARGLARAVISNYPNTVDPLARLATMTNSLLTAENRNLPERGTPLTAEGRLDERSTERLIDHLYAKGVGGLYVTGTTGEGIHLDSVIRRRLVEVAVHGSRGRGQVIVHVGATQASAAFEMAEHA